MTNAEERGRPGAAAAGCLGDWVGAGPEQNKLERRNRGGELTRAQSRPAHGRGLARPLRSAPRQQQGWWSWSPQVPAVQEQGKPLRRVPRRQPTLLFFNLPSSSPCGGQRVPSSSPPLPPLSDLDFLVFLSFALRKSTFQEDSEKLSGSHVNDSPQGKRSLKF